MRPSRALTTRAGLLTSLAYVALFAGIGAHLPYWPLWLADWGLTTAEVGRWLGLALFVRLVGSTVLPVLADRLGMRRALASAMALATVALFLGHTQIDTRGALLVATLLSMLFMSPLIPMTEALGVRAATGNAVPYAHARVAGSLAFLASATLLGWAIGKAGPDAALWTIVASFLLLAGALSVHPGGGAPPGTAVDTSRLAEAGALAVRPVFLIFAVAASVGQASHAVYYTYGTITWTEQGISADTIGLLWATGVAAEIALMLGPGQRLIERLSPTTLIAAGTIGGVVRWSLMAMEPSLWVLWPLQALHALSFAAAHLGAMAFVAQAIPARLTATAQGLFAGGLGGISFALSTLGAAEISAIAGSAAAYWLAAALSGTAFLAALMLRHRWNGGLIAT